MPALATCLTELARVQLENRGHVRYFTERGLNSATCDQWWGGEVTQRLVAAGGRHSLGARGGGGGGGDPAAQEGITADPAAGEVPEAPGAHSCLWKPE